MSTRYIELYSGNRNRLLYPNPASFEVPFASIQNATTMQSVDPVCSGGIYYYYTLSSQSYPYIYGSYKEGSSSSSCSLLFNYYDIGNTIKNFYNGYFLLDDASGEIHTIRSFDPSTASVTFDIPFNASIMAGNTWSIYAGYPSKYSIFIPSIDNNGNTIDPNGLAYNGYYVVFETDNPNYSNSMNSNIFYKQISYYDNVNQIAYFSEPLSFDYTNNSNIPQSFTLRKTLPYERWTLDTTTFYNNVCVNQSIGPQVGWVVTLPEGASTVDNFYTGKCIYVVSNPPQTYSPPLPSRSQLTSPVSSVFYPIYGIFYISAYNGSTRQCSIKTFNQNDINKSDVPTYQCLPCYDSSSFYLMDDSNFSSIQNMGNGVYRALTSQSINWSPATTANTASISLDLPEGGTYEITLTIRKSANILNEDSSGWFRTVGTVVEYIAEPNMQTYYQTYTFTQTLDSKTSTRLDINFFIQITDGQQGYVEWNLLEVVRVDTINIVNYENDNFNPLDYNGTLVSQNQSNCYQITLQSLTLPNRYLLTGSRIAFYQYIYVEFTNATSPTNSTNVIVSNNPHSKRALFNIAIPQVSNPEQQTFVTLSGGATQIVKFKPNDNFRLSIYLPDGTPFQTLIPDSFGPYPPDPQIQVDAIFSFHRL